jgi:hypothetical protein
MGFERKGKKINADKITPAKEEKIEVAESEVLNENNQGASLKETSTGATSIKDLIPKKSEAGRNKSHYFTADNLNTLEKFCEENKVSESKILNILIENYLKKELE